MRASEEKAVQQKIANQDASWLDWLEIGSLDASAEVEEVLDLVARGMRDGPLHVAAFGKDPERRRRRVRALMAGAFSARDFSHTLVARRQDGGPIVGVCAVLAPGECPPDLLLGQRSGPEPATTLRPIGPGVTGGGAARRTAGVCHEHDGPEGRHWHLGPVAVEAHLRGMGVRNRLMGVFRAKMDAAHADAHVQTDEPADVRFYERFGFEVVGEQEEVLGVSNRFMLRRARRGNGWRDAKGSSEGCGGQPSAGRR